MKDITNDIQQHFSKEILTIATCWQLILKDNTAIGFTDFDQDLVIDNIIYHCATGFTAKTINYNSLFTHNDTKIEAILNSNYINEKDILAGKYDHSTIKIFMVNYNHLEYGKFILQCGTIDKINLSNGKFIAEIKGLSTKLYQSIGDIYSYVCRTQFCDKKCGLNLADFTEISIITKVIDNRKFEDCNLKKEDGYYIYGTVKFLDGENSGVAMEIKDYQKDTISLFINAPYTICLGDRYAITVGCDKKFLTCKKKFNNSINFRGEPHLPQEKTLVI